MIENSVELKVAARQLQILEHALQSLRDQLSTENPWLLGVTEKAYTRRISGLSADIAGYLSAHPESVPLILPPIDHPLLPTEVEEALAGSIVT